MGSAITDSLVSKTLEAIPPPLRPVAIVVIALVVLWLSIPRILRAPGGGALLAIAYNLTHPIWLQRRPKTSRYRIAVARFDRDHDDSLAPSVVSALETLAPSLNIEPVFLRKVLRIRRSNRLQDASRASARGRKYIDTVNADALVWGEMGAGGVVNAYWTPAGSRSVLKTQYPLGHPLVFSNLLRHDLLGVLSMLSMTLALTHEQADSEDIDRLEAELGKAQALLTDQADLPQDTRASFLFVCAEAEIRLGLLQSSRASFTAAIDSLNHLAEIWSEEARPSWYAGILVNRGNVRSYLARLDASASGLGDAISDYKEAERVASGVPDRNVVWLARENLLHAVVELADVTGDWSSAEVELAAAVKAMPEAHDAATSGPALGSLKTAVAHAQGMMGSAKSDPDLLQESIRMGLDALSGIPEDSPPRAKAKLHTNTGIAQRRLGEILKDAKYVNASVESHRSARALTRREDRPFEWAECTNNLANSLALLGSTTKDSIRLKEALQCHSQVLEIRTRAVVPIAWAKTRSNMGIVLRMLFELEDDATRLARSIASFLDAWSVYSELGHSNQELIKYNLAQAVTLGTQRGVIEEVLKSPQVDRALLERFSRTAMGLPGPDELP